MSSNEPTPITGNGSSTKLLAAVVLLLTFIAGAVIGAVADRVALMMRGRMSPHTAQSIVNRLDRHLDLDDRQRTEVTEIVRRHQARIISLWAGVRPQVQQELEAANREIELILTPEQRKKFDRMKLHLPQPGRGLGGMRGMRRLGD